MYEARHRHIVPFGLIQFQLSFKVDLIITDLRVVHVRGVHVRWVDRIAGKCTYFCGVLNIHVSVFTFSAEDLKHISLLSPNFPL